jgi:hypothetical protein
MTRRTQPPADDADAVREIARLLVDSVVEETSLLDAASVPTDLPTQSRSRSTT